MSQCRTVYFRSDLSESSRKAESYATTYDDAARFAEAIASVQGGAISALQAPIVIKVIAHLQKLAAWKQPPEYKVCRLRQEPGLQK